MEYKILDPRIDELNEAIEHLVILYKHHTDIYIKEAIKETIENIKIKIHLLTSRGIDGRL